VAIRDIDEDAWLNLAIFNIDHSYSPRIVVDDCRFPNEYWALKERGFVFVRIVADITKRVDRLKKIGKWENEEQLNHVSESYVDGFATDYTIYNNDETLLESVLDDLMRRLAT